jgi:nucleoside-diphosphate kinase
MKMNKTLAATFYQEHKDMDFYNDLIDFMTSGPIVAMVIEKENAIEDFRNLMGSTDPSKSKPGTLRYQYGTSIRANAIHGSQDEESAKREIDLIFTKKEIFSF